MSVPPDPAREALTARLAAIASGHLDDRSLSPGEAEECLAALAAAPPSPPDAKHEYAVRVLRNAEREFVKTGNPETAALLDAAARHLEAPPSPPLIEGLARAARRAKSVAAAPDYDEEAIRDALWHVVDLVLAAARGETREEPMT